MRVPKQAVRVRDAFMRIASHELKTPVAALFSAAQIAQRMLARETIQNDRLTKVLDMQVWQTRRLTKLINGLLDTTRIAAGTLSLYIESLDLKQVVRNVITELQYTTTQHTLVYEGQDTPLEIEGDSLRLEQVYYNLLQNAIKYSPDGGVITVSLDHDEQQAVIRIQDQGIGIPPEDLPHIFEPFYRSPAASASSVNGMGIGLYVTAQIIELHEGTLAVESTIEQGTTFLVTLPLKQKTRGEPDRAKETEKDDQQAIVGKSN